jgi:arginine/lysine/ornithine decarboxylase
MKRLYETLLEYPKEGYYPAHMPGHKGNMEEGFLREALRYDITEIDGFDNLHDPQGVIGESEKYAAILYGSEETHFLVGGSTSGILSAVLGTTRHGDKVIIARNCHRSVYNAVCEGRLECTYVYPEYIKDFGFPGGVNVSLLEEAIKSDPDIRAVVITSPTYEGVCSEVSSLAGVCHKYGKILIVDAAHGAHFGFSDGLPSSAVKQGADIVIHSVHKTLPSPTQTALIHINGQLVNREDVRRKLRIYQSSSPSYLLMAGIDNCMSLISDRGTKLFGDFERRLDKLEIGLRDLKTLKHISRDLVRSEEGAFDHDPGKLIISTAGSGISGMDLNDILRKEYRIQPEMASDTYCLMILTIMDTKEGFEKIKNALICIDEKLSQGIRPATGQQASADNVSSLYVKKAKEMMPAYKALEKESLKVNPDDAAGGISGDYISLYPPGIPLLIPGEEISKVQAEGIKEALRQGLRVQGLTEDGKIKILNDKNMK